MRSVLRFLGSRWFLSFVGVALLAALVWFLGPLLGFLESWIVRLAVILAMLLVWLGVNLLIDARRRKQEKALTEGVAAAPPDPTAQASAEETAALRERMTEALSALKRARGTRGYLYEQPWYVIIGPPGAGKTTALLNAGLRFPLAAEMGQAGKPVAGVGGTRMCDWWFTENAVLIDTAGRYTTQDSDSAVDRAGWQGFLDLLKRTRTRQPLNGVIVAISLTEIGAASPEDRLAHARAIRRRLKEITERLAVRVPVYAVFTKADLLAGFTDFFDDLDREKRAQVWGMTFPLERTEAGPVGRFPAEFGALVERLNARLFDRLQAERSPDRRALLAGFPAQVASLEQPIAEFLAEAFGGSRLDPAPFLRGVYMASGTQEGTPIDRLTGALARAFGVDQRRAPSLRPEQGRSYFLARLLRDVIFGEAMLVSRNPAAARRVTLARAGGYALALLAFLVLGGALWQLHAANQARVAESEQAIAEYVRTASALPLDPVSDGDLARIAPLLDQARNLPHGYAAGPGELSWIGFGLSQTAKMAQGARAVYRNALQYALLPRLIWRLESQMRGAINQPDLLYQATRVYLMLGSQGPLDKDLLRAWMQLDWQAAYPGPAQAPLRNDLAQHFEALLEQRLPQISLDGGLVEAARATFSRVPLAARVYSRIKPSAAAQSVPPWRPADALGPAGARVFVRASGKPLTDGIPGFFTVDGFHKVLLPALGSVGRELAGESWVLGSRSEVAPNSPQMLAMEQGVVALYTDDYARQWDAMLADLDPVPLRNMTQATQDLYILSSPQSPMRDLLTSIARQLTLSKPPAPPPGVAGAAGAAATGAAQLAANNAAAQLQGLNLLGTANAATPPPPPPGSVIDERYKALRDFVGSGPGAPMDAVLKLMNDLQQQLARLAAAPAGGAPPALTGEDPGTLLRAEASRDPQPVSRWLQAMAISGTALRGGGARAQTGAAFNGAGGPANLCRQAVTGRYPFVPGSPNGIPLDDFAHLFAPGGLIDGFFNTQLRPYVDTSGHVWRPQTVDGIPAPISPGDLAQFQRAAEIRDLFFAGGATTPTVRFDITPISMDAGAKQVTLDLDGLTITYANGPPRSTQVVWPGPNRMENVRLSFDPPPSGGTGVLQQSGPWALFRLFNQGRLVQAGSAERYTLSFQLGERQASFEIRAGSVLNPFSPEMLRDFRCPTIAAQ